ncbi:hypothetical protein EON68_00215 [archaeon]|nr:MAG: hypothetical protein EON68_00215 [archaeon]
MQAQRVWVLLPLLACRFMHVACVGAEAHSPEPLPVPFRRNDVSTAHTSRMLFDSHRAAEEGSPGAFAVRARLRLCASRARAARPRCWHSTQCTAHAPLRADANYYLGLLYYYGDGVEPSARMAFDFFKAAAGSGHVQAACVMGHLLSRGVAGHNVDLRAAYAYYAMAARGGDVEAALRAGEMLYSGRVRVPPSEDEEESIAAALQVRCGTSPARAARRRRYTRPHPPANVRAVLSLCEGRGTRGGVLLPRQHARVRRGARVRELHRRCAAVHAGMRQGACWQDTPLLCL